MASIGQRHRDSDATVVDRNEMNNVSDVNQRRILENPLVSPEKGQAKPKGDEEAQVIVNEKESLSDSTIKVKQLSWIQAAGLMMTEYIVIAILSFPSSYAILGMAGGLIATVVVGLCVLYTSHVLWRYCLAHPESTDICDLSSRLFPAKYRKAAFVFTSIAFLLNNLFIMGLHVLAGSVALNTLSGGGKLCTVVFAVIMVASMLVLSLPRELNQVAMLGFFAAISMLIALILCLAFFGVEDAPAGFMPEVPVTVRAWAAEGTTFVQGFNAFLNIVYTFVGQILIPSYVDDMKKPEDFPKALFTVTALEIIVFSLGGAIGYYHIGAEYVTSPAYGSLIQPYTKIVAGFTLPTLIIVGVLYANVTARFIFLQFFAVDSKHRLEHTVKGWTVWFAILLACWIVAFLIGDGIPFFNELLSLMSSLFDWYFGFVMEALAFFALYQRGARWTTTARKLETMVNVLIMISGFFILVGGCYSSISAIIGDYEAGTVSGAFSCENNGF
ncbi:hypothetical protein P389DRAFT_32478 [Cystobasidium minutum MCA 4210]|uniref:uncharacterized protein n=1 Tax=Cystobasidium minutum MCA 4210 TaxID=1397322 RepID=UPI0034CF0864|eukprot:jgi/Rhomi1/32478/CE32477_4872